MLNTLFTNDARQTLDQFRRSVDRMSDDFHGYQTQPAAGAAARERSFTFSPVVESGWDDNHLRLRAILPGVAENDVQVTVQNNQLVIDGERKAPEGFARNAFTQLAYGRFSTAFTFPSGLDLDHVQCRLQNGILEIRVPLLRHHADCGCWFRALMEAGFRLLPRRGLRIAVQMGLLRRRFHRDAQCLPLESRPVRQAANAERDPGVVADFPDIQMPGVGQLWQPENAATRRPTIPCSASAALHHRIIAA
jgi:HSP20 family protein